MASATGQIVTIGVSRYPDPSFGEGGLGIIGAENDALAIAGRLRENFNHFKFADSVILLGAGANLASIRSLQLSAPREPLGLFVLYLAGHAVYDPETKRAWYCTHDSIPTQPGITATDIDLLVEGFSADYSICILDCCHAEAIMRQCTCFQNLGKRNARIFLASSRAGQQSWDDLSGGWGIFSRQLMNQLNRPLDPGTSIERVFTDVARETTLSVLHDRGHVQEPVIGGAWSELPLLSRGEVLQKVRATSIAHVVRRRIRAVAISCGAVLAAGYVFSLHEFYHVLVDDRGYIEVQRGLPQLSFLLPHLLSAARETALRPEHLTTKQSTIGFSNEIPQFIEGETRDYLATKLTKAWGRRHELDERGRDGWLEGLLRAAPADARIVDQYIMSLGKYEAIPAPVLADHEFAYLPNWTGDEAAQKYYEQFRAETDRDDNDFWLAADMLWMFPEQRKEITGGFLGWGSTGQVDPHFFDVLKILTGKYGLYPQRYRKTVTETSNADTFGRQVTSQIAAATALLERSPTEGIHLLLVSSLKAALSEREAPYYREATRGAIARLFRIFAEHRRRTDFRVFSDAEMETFRELTGNTLLRETLLRGLAAANCRDRDWLAQEMTQQLQWSTDHSEDNPGFSLYLSDLSQANYSYFTAPGPPPPIIANDIQRLISAGAYLTSEGSEERLPKYFDPGAKLLEEFSNLRVGRSNSDLLILGLSAASWARIQEPIRNDVRQALHKLLNDWRAAPEKKTINLPAALFIAAAAEAGLLQSHDIEELARAVDQWLSASGSRYTMENIQLLKACDNRTVLALGLIAQKQILPLSAQRSLRLAYARFWWRQYMDEVAIGLAFQSGAITDANRFSDQAIADIKSSALDAEMRHASAAILREAFGKASPEIQAQIRQRILAAMRECPDYNEAVALMRIITPKRPPWMRVLISS